MKEQLRERMLAYVGDCTCDVAYTSRKLHDPQCVHCDVAFEDFLKDMADFVEMAQMKAWEDGRDAEFNRSVLGRQLIPNPYTPEKK